MMKAHIKQLWIEALRSGKIQQAREQLRAGDAMCCLGVLCDLHAQAGLGRWDGDVYVVGGAREIETLPAPVVEWAGLSGDSPSAGPDNYPLAAYNDGLESHFISPHTFLEIADLIEKHL
jgi:hypothetical protein